MNFGYLIFVKSNPDIDYLKLAYALALSIKNTQKEGYDKVALVIDNPDALNKINSPWVFDEVIEWGEQDGWDGRSWMHDLTPWDYTVCLDADMIFLRDYSHWIDYFVANRNLAIANKSYTFRNEIITSDYYRKTFTANDLPNLYSFYTFFKKNSSQAEEFFEIVKNITRYPDKFANMFLLNHKPKVIGTDEAFAMASKILGMEDLNYPLDFPKVVHLKPMLQKFPWPASLVSNHVGLYLDKQGNLKIGNFLQENIVHYIEKNFITDEIISILEHIAWKK